MPKHISEVLAETFRHAPTPENLTAWVNDVEGNALVNAIHARKAAQNPSPGSGAAWVDSQPIKGQLELPFCLEVNSEFTSDARPGADWGTWA